MSLLRRDSSRFGENGGSDKVFVVGAKLLADSILEKDDVSR